MTPTQRFLVLAAGLPVLAATVLFAAIPHVAVPQAAADAEETTTDVGEAAPVANPLRDADRLVFDFTAVDARLGLKNVLTHAAEPRHWLGLADLAWRRLQDAAEKKNADDLGLVFAEALFRIGDGGPLTRDAARAVFARDLAAHPRSANRALRLIRLGDLYGAGGFYPEAAGHYAAALDETLDDAAAVYALRRMADTLRRDGDGEGALATSARAAERTSDPRVRQLVALGTAHALHDLGRYPEAAAVYAEALPDPAEIALLSDDDLYACARTRFEVGDDSGAEAGFDLLEKRRPAAEFAAGVVYHKGLLRLRAGDAKGAAERFGKIRSDFRETDEYFPATVRLGELAAKSTPPDPARARELLGEAADQEDHIAARREALFLLGDLESAQGDDARALDRFGRLLEDVRGNPLASDGLRRIQEVFAAYTEKAVARGDFRAVALAFQAHRADLVNDLVTPETLDRVGRSLREKFLYGPLFRLFHDPAVARRHPDLSRFYLALVDLEEKDGEGEKPLASFAAETTDADLAARAWLVLGDRSLSAGNADAACAAWTNALTPGVADAWTFAALLRLAERDLATGDVESAYARYANALDLSPRVREPGANADLAFGIAECRHRMGKTDQAGRDFAEFLRRFPDDRRAVLARVRVARALALAGRTLPEVVAPITPDDNQDEATAAAMNAVAADLTWWAVHQDLRK
jgi:tetratricopeptide (TPR) repeat protein